MKQVRCKYCNEKGIYTYLDIPVCIFHWSRITEIKVLEYIPVEQYANFKIKTYEKNKI